MRVPQLFAKNWRGRSVVLSTTIAAGFGFTLFGYDQGVMSGIITGNSFLTQFPQTRDPSISGITVAIYEIGCLIGAASQIWLGDRMGRKTSILLGMVIMLVGTVIMTSSYSLGQFIVGRIVTGVGNGINTATIPQYQGECAPKRIRGALVLVSGALISGGIALAYIINLGFFFVASSATWRFPIAFQMVFAFAVMLMLLAIPESPAWLVKHGEIEEARDVLSHLTDVPLDDPSIDESITATQNSLNEIAAFQFKDLFTNGPTQNFRRAALAISSQAFQQLTGCNLITYYSATLFEDSIGLSPFLSRVLSVANGLEYFAAAIVAIFLVDRLGRRVTMLNGAIGCGLSMLILCITVNISDKGNKAASYAACVFLFVFNTCFAIGWLGSTWLYPSEITTLGIRSQTAALSTCSNWIWNFVVVMITPPAFASIGSFTYLIFAILNLCLLFPAVYFFYPETKRRSLEEVDLLFAEAFNEKKNYVHHSLTRPHISGAELDEELALAYAKGKATLGGTSSHIENAPGRGPLRRLATEQTLRRTDSSQTAVEATVAGGDKPEKELKAVEATEKAV